MTTRFIVSCVLTIWATTVSAQTNTFPTTGSVGIGTTSPATKLTLQDAQTELSMGHNADPTTYNRFGFNSQYFGYWTQNAYWTGSAWNFVNPGGYGGKAVKLQQYNGTFQIDTGANVSGQPSWSTRLFVDFTGNVGLGTVSPQRVLHVQSAAADSHIYVSDTAPSLTFGNHSVYGAGNKFAVLGFATANGNYGANAGDLVLATYGSAHGDIYLNSNYYSSNTNSKIVLQPMGGGVGIGTGNVGTNKLVVNGTIRAKEVVVDTGWSDYVFDEHYRLAPLSEVEQHIKTEKHLPGIPSAAEVAENGVSMGEMQAKLLAKVEELTLHLICQEKAIDQLKSQNTSLQNRIAELESSRAP